MLFLFCRRLCRDADAGSDACARWHPYQCICKYQYQHHSFLRNAQHNLFRIFKASTHNSFLAHCIKQITRLICFISFLFHLNAHIIHGSCLQLTFFYGFFLVCSFIILFFLELLFISCCCLLCTFLFWLHFSLIGRFSFFTLLCHSHSAVQINCFDLAKSITLNCFGFATQYRRRSFVSHFGLGWKEWEKEM